MRCKNCDYPLWNLTTRICPECGTSFAPGEHEFVTNTVRFCCPECDQSYYGTDRSGHLVPQRFDCVKCGKSLHMDQMVLRPASGVEEKQTKKDVNPWLERKQRGVVKAWLATVGRSFAAQSALMRGLGEQVRASDAWLFAAMTFAVWYVFGAGSYGFLYVMLEGAGTTSAFFGRTALGTGSTLAVIAVIYVVLLAIWIGVTHLMLRITGGAKFSIGRTAEAILYCSGVTAPMAVPLVGLYCGSSIFFMWWIVGSVLAVWIGQSVHGGRAALAVLTAPGLTMVAGVVLFSILMANVRTTMTMAGSALGAATTQSMVMDVRRYMVNNGAPPTHAAELLLDQSTMASQLVWSTGAAGAFTNWATQTTGVDVPLGANATLADFWSMSGTQRRDAVRASSNALPTNVVAHRYGDYVFTYHGMSAQSQGSLWLVVFLPDPDVNGIPLPSDTIEVGLASGVVSSFTFSQLPAQLQQQNQLRAQAGLAPLPDLMTITHSNPAGGS